MLTVGQLSDHLEELVESLEVELAGLPLVAQEAAIISFEKSLREESIGEFQDGKLIEVQVEILRMMLSE